MNEIPKNNEPCLTCGRFANRGTTIDAVIVREGKILLIKRGAEPFKGYWALPGGYVEWDETVEDAVKREVKEETGLDATGLKLIGIYSDPIRHPKQVIDAAYFVEVKGEAKAGDDAMEFQWADLKELPELAFDHRQIVNDYIRINYEKNNLGKL